MTYVNAGQYDQRITLQSRAAGVDATGQANGAWSDVATVWAQAQPLRGREFFSAGQTQSQVEVRFRIRYRVDITSVMRVIWRGQPYDIVSPPIEIDGAKVALELMCSTGERDGR